MYRQKDIDKYNLTIKNVIEKVNTLTKEECRIATKIVLNFLKSKKRVLYGGTAVHYLIRAKNPKDGVYNDADCPDIDVYSPDPIDDIMQMIPQLKKTFGNVTSKDGMHQGTYKLYVDYEPVCDLSYMHPKIFDKLQTVDVGGLLCVHPSFMIIDVYREFGDPLGSYWRLVDKNTLMRSETLLKYYPLKLSNSVDDRSPPLKYNPGLELVYADIKGMSSLIHSGNVAESAFMGHTTPTFCTPLVVMSIHLKDDVERVHRIVLKHFPRATLKSYRKFFTFWDERSVISDPESGEELVTIIGHNDVCQQYIQYGSIKMMTFNNFFCYQMINILYLRTYSKDTRFSEKLVMDMLTARYYFLENNNLTVMDPSIFQEFVTQCHGKSVNFKDTFFNRKFKFEYPRFTQKNYDQWDGGEK
jgi:hypothetical protein